MRQRVRRIAAVMIGAVLVSAAPAHAEQIRVLSSVAVKAIIEALAPEFARISTHTIASEFGLAAAMKTRIEGGEPFDLAILTPAMLDDLAAKGLIASDARPVVARSGLGLMVKAGSVKPNVNSVDAFKRALLGARAITYVPTSASGLLFSATLDKLGIADAVKAKTKAAASADEVNANIINGVADVAVLPVSEILPVPGAELGGVFPAEIQSYIVMAAGANARSPRAAAAREFVTFLTSPMTTAAIKSKGMER
jgi:molybdate transport system substrate-binding protein